MSMNGDEGEERPISEMTRQLLLRVCDGCPELPPYLWQLSRFRRRDEILRWLIANRITGREFLQWAKVQCNGSALQAGAFVLSKIEREGAPRPVLAGIDYITQ